MKYTNLHQIEYFRSFITWIWTKNHWRQKIKSICTICTNGTIYIFNLRYPWLHCLLINWSQKHQFTSNWVFFFFYNLDLNSKPPATKLKSICTICTNGTIYIFNLRYPWLHCLSINWSEIHKFTSNWVFLFIYNLDLN